MVPIVDQCLLGSVRCKGTLLAEHRLSQPASPVALSCFLLDRMAGRVVMKRKRRPGLEDYYLETYRGGAKPYVKKKRLFRAGRDRVGGYYGRYAGKSGELKFFDRNADNAAIATAGVIIDSINLIPQGVTESTRVGRKCTLKSIHWHYQMDLPEADAVGTPAPGDTARLIVYLDKQANGATAAVTDILESASWQSFYNLSNSSRFVILIDKTHSMNYSSLASDGAGVVSSAERRQEWNWNKRCSIPVEFSDVTGAITEVRSNNVGILLISSAAVIGITSKLRVRFSDSS